MRKFVLVVVTVVLAAVLGQMRVGAQTAQVTGRVSDPADASVAGATVTVTNVETGITRDVVSNEEGYYTISSLPNGSYRLSVARDGFKSVNRSDLTLNEGQVLRLDFALEIGGAQETVEVTGSSALALEKETPTVSTVIPNEKIVDLPLVNRNIITLAALAPTVRPVGQFGGLPVSSFDGARLSIGGGPPSSNNLQIDGIAAENFTSGGLNIFLSVDATEEFRVITRNPSAEFGRTGGGVVNIISKSGTNEFHGTLYEFHRNAALNANDFFLNRAGRDRPKFILNQYGATIGGPIFKKRTFFFFNFEGFRLIEGQQAVRTVPTAAQRNGDFRGTLDAQGRQVMIYDPATTRPNPNGAGFIRNVISCNGEQNVICPDRINPVARAVLNSYPLPNQPGIAGTGANNFLGVISVPSNKDIYGIKIDHNFTPTRRLSGRYTYDKTFRGDTNIFGNVAEPNESELVFRRDSVALNYTDALTPTLLVEARAGLNRYAPTRIVRSIDFDLTSLGFAPALNSQVQLRQYPRFNISDINTIGSSQGDQLIQANNSYTAGVNFTKTLATQSIKFGVEQRVYQLNNTQISIPVAQFDFSRSFTQGPNPASTGTNLGYGVATFLLGNPTGGSVGRFAVSTYTVKHTGLFVQDDWKVTPKLTLNLGLRWEYEGSATDRYDAIANFDPALPVTVGGVNFRGGLIYPGTGDLSRGYRDVSKTDFGPRVGFAYQLFDRTVLRAGYGIYYLPTTGNYVTLGRTGYDFSTPLVATDGSVNGGFSPTANLANPYPSGVLAPIGNTGGPTTGFGTGVAGNLRSLKRGYSQQFSANVQHELPGSFVVELGYVGNRGVSLAANRVYDYLPAAARQQFTVAQLQETIPNPYLGIITTGTLAQQRVARATLIDTYPQYLGASGLDSWGDSIYHAGTIKVDRRFMRGFSVLAAYTFSKLIDNNLGNGLNGFTDSGNEGVQNWDDLRAERSISSNDLPHRLTVSAIYDVPLGREGNRVYRALLGGFQINPILTVQSGNPIGITTGAGGQPFAGNRPNLIGDPRPDDPTLDRYLNSAAFQVAPALTFGNAPRNLPDYRSPGLKTLDVALMKNIAFTESRRLQLRAEGFNITNTPQFGNPNTSFGTGGFGFITSTRAGTFRQFQVAAKFYF